MEKVTHWKALQDNEFIGAYILQPNEDMVLTIKSVALEKFKDNTGKEKTGRTIHFVENVPPFLCNATNAKTIANIYKTPFVEEWIGKKIQLYSAKVKAFGSETDALRIRNFVPFVCEKCGNAISAFKNLTAVQLSSYTIRKYDESLCADCAEKAKKEFGGV